MEPIEPSETDEGVTYYPPVDPGGGYQKGSTAASALGFAALVGSGAGDKVASALGLGAPSPEIYTAGFSLASLGSLNLFTVGLVLVGIGIILNVLSMAARHQHHQEFMAEAARTGRKIRATRR